MKRTEARGLLSLVLLCAFVWTLHVVIDQGQDTTKQARERENQVATTLKQAQQDVHGHWKYNLQLDQKLADLEQLAASGAGHQGPCPGSLAASIQPTLKAQALQQLNSLRRLGLNASDQRQPEEGGKQHKLAIILPYRNREDHLRRALPALRSFLAAQVKDFSFFIIEQVPTYRFNRGALLNVGVQLLEGSDYDYYAFQDIDTLPKLGSGVEYAYPAGTAPIHLTPSGIHPKVKHYEDFFGGITIFTRQQVAAVNGFGVNFWGWGREDDNMRERLKLAGRWPAQVQGLPKGLSQHYFTHLRHQKAKEVRVSSMKGSTKYFEADPSKPYGNAVIVSSQKRLLLDTQTGLNTTRFWIQSISAYQDYAVRYTVELHCNISETPWCLPSPSEPEPQRVRSVRLQLPDPVA